MQIELAMCRHAAAHPLIGEKVQHADKIKVIEPTVDRTPQELNGHGLIALE